jgi:hypothetical protein
MQYSSVTVSFHEMGICTWCVIVSCYFRIRIGVSADLEVAFFYLIADLDLLLHQTVILYLFFSFFSTFCIALSGKTVRFNSNNRCHKGYTLKVKT